MESDLGSTSTRCLLSPVLLSQYLVVSVTSCGEEAIPTLSLHRRKIGWVEWDVDPHPRFILRFRLVLAEPVVREDRGDAATQLDYLGGNWLWKVASGPEFLSLRWEC